jgi:hypothetical protein
MRVFFSSLRCFFFAIRLRRFLITEPTVYLSGIAVACRHDRVGPEPGNRVTCRDDGRDRSSLPAAPLAAVRRYVSACMHPIRARGIRA